MNIDYYLLRFRLFRNEYLGHARAEFRSGWMWLCNFTLDTLRYLFLGEINQYGLLRGRIRQMERYIELLQPGNPPAVARTPIPGNRFVFSIRVLLLPAVVAVYLAGRVWRIFYNRHLPMLISEFRPTSDMTPVESCSSDRPAVFLVPAHKRRLPNRLVFFRFRLTVRSGTPRPALLIDTGVGLSPEYTIPLPWSQAQPHQELLLELPPQCSCLKMQITESGGEFVLDEVSILETNLFKVIVYLFRVRKLSSGEIFNTLMLRHLPGIRRTLAHRASYAEWHSRYQQLSNVDRKAIRHHLEQLPVQPLFSIILHIKGEAPDMVERTLLSLRAQAWRHWEVLIMADNATDVQLIATLNRHERADDRVRIVVDADRVQIATDIASALPRVRGEYTGLLEPGDLLEEHALYLFCCGIQDHPDAKLLYSDFDHIDHHGALSDPVLKPDWDYDLLLGENYLQYMQFYQTPLLRSVATEPGPAGCDPWNLNLLAIERLSATEIVHLPWILLHHRNSTVNLSDMNADRGGHQKAALERHLARTGQPATVIPTAGGFRIQYRLPDEPPVVTLIVLTRDRFTLLSNCINGLLQKTAWPQIEIIIVDNGTTEEAALGYLEAIDADPRVSIIRCPGPFNFAALNNLAVKQVRGEYIGLINNDIIVIEPGWLDEMMGQLLRPGVGIVGAKLLYENETIQHGGVIIGLGGVAGHAFRHFPRYHPGFNNRLLLTRRLSCVTGACLLTRKSLYDQVGGLDERNLRVAFNDVDYCLKIRKSGYNIIWTPFAELFHLESASRGSDLASENIDRWNDEFKFMKNRWGDTLSSDPYYNPNLAITDEEFTLAHPPRVIRPWDPYRYS